MGSNYTPKCSYTDYYLYSVQSEQTTLGNWIAVPDEVLGKFKVRDNSSVRRAFLYRLKCVGIICNSNKTKIVPISSTSNLELTHVVTHQPLYRFSKEII